MDFLSVDFPAWLASRKSTWRQHRKRIARNYRNEMVGQGISSVNEACEVIRTAVQQNHASAVFLHYNDPFPEWTKEVAVPITANATDEVNVTICYVPPRDHRRLRSRAQAEHYGHQRDWSAATIETIDFQPVFCLCHLPEDESDYVECCVGLGGCNGWFHPKCVGWQRPLQEIRALDSPVICPLCSALLEAQRDTSLFEGRIVLRNVVNSPPCNKAKRERKQWNYSPGNEYEYYEDDAVSSLTSITATSLPSERDEHMSAALLDMVEYGARSHRLWGIAGTPHSWMNTHTQRAPKKKASAPHLPLLPPDLQHGYFIPSQLPNAQVFPPPGLADRFATLPRLPQTLYQDGRANVMWPDSTYVPRDTQVLLTHDGEDTSHDTTMSNSTDPTTIQPASAIRKRPVKRQRVDPSRPIAVMDDGTSVKVKLMGGWMRRGAEVVMQERQYLQSKLLSHEAGLHLTTQYRVKFAQKIYSLAVTAKSSATLQNNVFSARSYVPMTVPLPCVDGRFLYTCISMHPQLSTLHQHCELHCAYCFRPLQIPGTRKISRSLHTVFDGPHRYRIHNDCFIALTGCNVALDTESIALCHIHDDSNNVDAACDICGRIGALLQHFRIIHPSGNTQSSRSGRMWLGHPYCIRWLLRSNILRIIEREELINSDCLVETPDERIDTNCAKYTNIIAAVMEYLIHETEDRHNRIDLSSGVVEESANVASELDDNVTGGCTSHIDGFGHVTELVSDALNEKLKVELQSRGSTDTTRDNKCASTPIKTTVNLFDTHFDKWRCSICGNRTGLTVCCAEDMCRVHAHPICALLEKWRLLKHVPSPDHACLTTVGIICPIHDRK